ncbi:glycosyltransferase family 4 protein [Sediminibacterium sp.]|uniref:glycosyltransferase family 4 protein n=1 Tax=Sediminibacterium sp. TaxID=1917865 RepID=UPI003F6FE719
MEIIHLVFTRNAKAKYNSLVETTNQLATEQVKIGYNVTLWQLGSKAVDIFKNKAYKTKYFSTNLFMWNTVHKMLNDIDEIKKNTIVHIHGGIIPIYYPIIFHLNKRNISFILSPHGRYNSYALEHSSFLKRKHFDNFDANIIQWAKAIHFRSEFERTQLISYCQFDLQKSYIVPIGLINNNIDIAPKIMKHDEIIYCYYGELNISEMGIDILLHAFAKFKKQQSNNAILWIMGNGSDRNAILKLIKKLSLHKYVFLKPAVFGALKFEQLSKIDIMVRPSRLDYAPTVVLESAAMSIPSIVSENTYLVDLIKNANAGYTLTKNTSDELMKVFIESMAEIETVHWNRKKLNARQMIVDSCSWNKIAREHVEVYKGLV